MPSVVSVPLDLEPGSTVTPDRLRGVVSTWIEGDLSVKEHRAPRKGYSVAVEHGSGRRIVIRVGIVDDTLLEPLAAAVDQGLRAGRLQGSYVEAKPPVVTSTASWEQLIGCAEASQVAPRSFRFHSHTGLAFRSGSLTNPLPLPGNVFGHLRARWSEFAPPELVPDLGLRELGLVISRLQGRTELTVVRGQRYPGFVGSFTIHAATAADRDRRVLEALAHLTPFAGIGANTTVGMGRCDYLPR